MNIIQVQFLRRIRGKGIISMIIFAAIIKTETMKSLKILSVAIIVAVGPSSFSQTPALTPLSDLSTFMLSDYNYLEEQRTRNAIIEGTPYLDEEFTEGSLVFKDKYYKELQLRYNMYEGHFEFKSDGQVLYFDPRYTEVDTVWMGENKFIFHQYQDVRNAKRSYMQLLYENKGTRVLSLRETVLLHPESAKGYEDAKPARFQQHPDRLFVSLQGKPAQEFSGRKSIPDLFPNYADELTAYAKKKRLRFRQSEELIELCKHYDVLRQ